MRRVRPLPLGRSGPNRLMPVILAPMAYIATLALAGFLVVQGLVADWRAGMDGVLTVEIPAAADIPTTQARVSAALAALGAHPDVASAEVITAERADRMLQDWVGDAVDLSAFPLPILLDIRLVPGAGEGEAAVQALLQAVPEAEPIRAEAWLEELRGLVDVIELAALGVLALAVAAAVATVIAVSAANFTAWRSVVELLHVMGAEDRFVAGAFQRAALRQAGLGGLVGVGLAAATGLAVAWSLGRVDPLLVDQFALPAWAWWPLALVPVGTALLAMVTARLTVLLALRRLT
ncbi:MAG: hypothetical protein H6843_07640 [Rhodospirillaceae bacterium]|nr:hypothetical protein [Rhodospirillaceae bacterium]